jgi:ZipA, C-terminal FtsZ-binding domain
MKSLQFWLALIGGALLLALLIHGAWQTRSVGGLWRRRGVRGGGEAPSDTQLGPPTEVLEPRFDEAAAVPAAVTPAGRPVDAGAPAAAPAVRRVVPAEMPPLPPRRPLSAARIDPAIDAVAPLRPEAPVSGDTVLAHLPPSRRAGGKPFAIEALNLEDGVWELPAPGHRYGAFQAGLQLAHRLGPINEIEYSEFVQKVQAFADAVGAVADFPDMLEAVARGRALDAFASEHDALLAVRLCTRQTPWPLSWVTQHAARHGFVLGSTPGRLVLPARSEGAPPMLTLQFDAQAALADDVQNARVGEISLVFDVPQTAPVEEPFNAWCAASQALAIALDGRVFDDQGRELGPDDFVAIGDALRQNYQQLADSGIPAGSAAARRLFS